MRTPDFLIVGAAKSGTTSLSNYLNQHPKIEIVSNRLEHFGEYSNTMMENLSQEDYLNLFNSIPEDKLAGEKSVSYLYSDLAPQQIHTTNPSIKILIILRNPIDRAYSDYWHRRRNGMENLTFEKALDIEKKRIEGGAPFEQHYAYYGLYAKRVKAYFSLFGQDQCKIFLFEDFTQNPQKICARCFDFLNVEQPEQAINFAIHNKGGTPKDHLISKPLFKLSRKRWAVKIVRSFIPKKLKTAITDWMNSNTDQKYPEMEIAIRNQLREFYRADIQKLEKILGRDLNHWLSN